ncbi:hypothetical protein C8R46DRAFT_1201904 [Mycena filopes]|nr:hypothetical protein C8R46DRAFT_1201904 [Mycena filopes]
MSDVANTFQMHSRHHFSAKPAESRPRKREWAKNLEDDRGGQGKASSLNVGDVGTSITGHRGIYLVSNDHVVDVANSSDRPVGRQDARAAQNRKLETMAAQVVSRQHRVSLLQECQDPGFFRSQLGPDGHETNFEPWTSPERQPEEQLLSQNNTEEGALVTWGPRAQAYAELGQKLSVRCPVSSSGSTSMQRTAPRAGCAASRFAAVADATERNRRQDVRDASCSSCAVVWHIVFDSLQYFIVMALELFHVLKIGVENVDTYSDGPCASIRTIFSHGAAQTGTEMDGVFLNPCQRRFLGRHPRTQHVRTFHDSCNPRKDKNKTKIVYGLRCAARATDDHDFDEVPRPSHVAFDRDRVYHTPLTKTSWTSALMRRACSASKIAKISRQKHRETIPIGVVPEAPRFQDLVVAVAAARRPSALVDSPGRGLFRGQGWENASRVERILLPDVYTGESPWNWQSSAWEHSLPYLRKHSNFRGRASTAPIGRDEDANCNANE